MNKAGGKDAWRAHVHASKILTRLASISGSGRFADASTLLDDPDLVSVKIGYLYHEAKRIDQ